MQLQPACPLNFNELCTSSLHCPPTTSLLSLFLASLFNSSAALTYLPSFCIFSSLSFIFFHDSVFFLKYSNSFRVISNCWSSMLFTTHSIFSFPLTRASVGWPYFPLYSQLSHAKLRTPLAFFNLWLSSSSPWSVSMQVQWQLGGRRSMMERFVPSIMRLSAEGEQLTGHTSHEQKDRFTAELHSKLQVNAFNFHLNF